MNQIKYAQATSKLQKSIIVSSIVDTVRESSPSGGFVRGCQSLCHSRQTGHNHAKGSALGTPHSGSNTGVVFVRFRKTCAFSLSNRFPHLILLPNHSIRAAASINEQVVQQKFEVHIITSEKRRDTD